MLNRSRLRSDGIDFCSEFPSCLRSSSEIDVDGLSSNIDSFRSSEVMASDIESFGQWLAGLITCYKNRLHSGIM